MNHHKHAKKVRRAFSRRWEARTKRGRTLRLVTELIGTSKLAWRARAKPPKFTNAARARLFS
ncbi:hypothetical protein BC938DRAFT_474869 [Jimgerdemannia flammicorona]|uniref:Uncharacterized protein n=1 Tax=Jimgerdemannia flammicorona TaxID=994334 RepID=A0A433Q1D6_9FUNG|nr:hypothetical protein BC938DRAFT_474869 [Jimgerdemannia flammicorona]